MRLSSQGLKNRLEAPHSRVREVASEPFTWHVLLLKTLFRFVQPALAGGAVVMLFHEYHRVARGCPVMLTVLLELCILHVPL